MVYMVVGGSCFFFLCFFDGFLPVFVVVFEEEGGDEESVAEKNTHYYIHIIHIHLLNFCMYTYASKKLNKLVLRSLYFCMAS